MQASSRLKRYAGGAIRIRGRRGFWKLGAVLTAVALGSAACGGGGGESESGGDGELLVWASREYYVPPDEFKSFQEEHPDINFSYDVQADDDILQQLLRMREAGQPMPDVIQDDTFMMEAYYEAGLLQPIDEQMQTWKEEAPQQYNSILPNTWEDTKFDGKHYGMSITANYDLLYFNKQWFEEAGVEPPFETFDQLYDALVKMKQARPNKTPMSLQALAGEGVTMLKSMLAAVGTPFDGATPDLTDPAAQYVLDFFIRAQKDGLIPEEAISWGESETRGCFIRQDCGLVFDGITTAGDFNKVQGFKYDQQWDTTPLPTDTGQGHSGQPVTAPRTWAVTVDADDPYQSSLVLRYLAETDNLIEPLQNGSVPMRQTEALNDPRMQEAIPFFDEEMKQDYLDSQSMPSAPNTGEVEQILEQMWGEIVQGTDKSAQELGEEYQQQLDAL